MDVPGSKFDRLLGWRIGAVALAPSAAWTVLALLFPNSGESSGVVLGCFLFGVLCAALAGFVASLVAMTDVPWRKEATTAVIMNLSAAALPFVWWLLYLVTRPS